MGYHSTTDFFTTLSKSVLCSYPTLASHPTCNKTHNDWPPKVVDTAGIHFSFNPTRCKDHEDPYWRMFLCSIPLKPSISFDLLAMYPMISDLIPSGKNQQYYGISLFFNRNTHYFYGHVQKSVNHYQRVALIKSHSTTITSPSNQTTIFLWLVMTRGYLPWCRLEVALRANQEAVSRLGLF